MHIVMLQDGYSTLMRVCRKGYAEIVQMLIQHGADVNMQDKVRNIYYNINFSTATTCVYVSNRRILLCYREEVLP